MINKHHRQFAHSNELEIRFPTGGATEGRQPASENRGLDRSQVPLSSHPSGFEVRTTPIERTCTFLWSFCGNKQTN